MRRDEVLARLNAELPDLRARFDVKSIGIFGSVARGDDGPESDVDVLVEFEGGPTLRKWYTLHDHLALLLRSSVDLVTIGALRDRFQTEVERDIIRVA